MNMHKFIYGSLMFFVFLCALVAVPVFSQSPTPEEGLADEVDKLKEKVAEKVEELKNNNEKAVAGIVTTMGSKAWSITNNEGTAVDIDIDDTLTEFYEISGTRITDLDQEDIEESDYIFVTGPVIDEVVTANAVYRDQQYLLFSGKITQANEEDFTMHIVTVDKSNYIFDIERGTSQKILDIETLERDTIGFSKLKEGDSVHVVVKGNPENPSQTRFDAEKVLVIPNEYFIQ